MTLTAVGITDTQTAPAGSLATGPTCTASPARPAPAPPPAHHLGPRPVGHLHRHLHLTQADLNNGSVNDSATATGTPPTGPASPRPPRRPRSPSPRPRRLTVVKTVTSTGPYNTVGQTITYQFVATNTGNTTLNGVAVNDTQTAPAGSLATGPTCSCCRRPPPPAPPPARTTLLPGQTATFTATYTSPRPTSTTARSTTPPPPPAPRRPAPAHLAPRPPPR